MIDEPGHDGVGSEATVLVAVENDRNRELLSGMLEEAGYDVLLRTNGTGLADGPVDLCITDQVGTRRVADDLQAYRRNNRPEYLPWLQIVSEGNFPRGGSVALDGVDDVIEVPVRKADLRRRIESLLRARTLSVELEERDAQYRRLLRLAPDAIVLLSDGEIVYGNQAAHAILSGDPHVETSADPYTGVEFASMVASESRPGIQELLDGLGTDGSNTRMIELTITPDQGDPIHTEATGVNVPYHGGFATQLVLRDVTDRDVMEQRLRLFGRAMGEASVGVSIADMTQPDDPLIYVNRTFEEITGYQTGEILGQNCRFLQGAGTDPETVTTIREAIDREESLSIRIRNYRKDGTPFWNELELTPVQNLDGAVTHYIGFQRDVTEREERKRALEEYETIFGAAGEAIYSLDVDGHFTNVNDALTSLVGYDESELLGEHISKVMQDEDDLETGQRLLRRLLDRDEPSGTAEVTLETASGDQRRCVVTVAILPHDGDFRGTVGVIRDVTEIRQREQQLAVMDRILRHDIRNTMNVIQGRAEILARELGETDENVREIVAATESLLALSEHGRKFHDTFFDSDAHLRTVDLVARVDRIVGQHRTEHPNAAFSVDLVDSAPVRAHDAIDHALEELVENAIVHNDGEIPHVDVAVRRDGEEVVVVIADDGPGLPMGEQNTLTGDIESALEHASGLGLWMVSWIVSASNGTVECQPREPRGTCMTVRFSAADR